MTIERLDAKAKFAYRRNPYSPFVIDRKRNKPGARWQSYAVYDSEREVLEVLHKLQRGEEGKA